MERDDELMPLSRALHILAEVHTQDNDRVGFAVIMGARPEYGSPFGGDDYTKAWASVRHAVGKSAFPPAA